MSGSFGEEFSYLFEQWHPTKNGNLKLEQVSPGSRRKVWWHYHYTDPRSGKEFDFEWQDTIVHRTKRGDGCPFLSGHKVWKGFNDLQTTHPELAAEWHQEKNGDFFPDSVTSNSNIMVWWHRIYFDNETGKQFDFEWKASIKNRVRSGSGCPYLTGYAVWTGFNDISSRYPDVAKEWHPTKNGDTRPDGVLYRSLKQYWWLTIYDDPNTNKHYEFEWKASAASRTIRGMKCPFLSGKSVWRGFNDLNTTYPLIAAEWHPTKNGTLTPEMVSYGCGRSVWWQITYADPLTGKTFILEWKAKICNRTIGHSGCPFLSGKAVQPGFNDLKSRCPTLAAEWHPTKNGSLTPEKVTCLSSKRVWWFLPYDDPSTGKHFDFEWRASISSRYSYKLQCPFLTGNRVFPGFNDLQTRFPQLASEMMAEKNNGLTPSQVTAYSNKKIYWQCSKCGRIWRAAINTRANTGPMCPQCIKKRL